MADHLQRFINSARRLEAAQRTLGWARTDLHDAPWSHDDVVDGRMEDTRAGLRASADLLDSFQHPAAARLRAIADGLHYDTMATPAQIADTVAAIDVVGVVLAGDLEEVEHQLGVDLPCMWPIEQEPGDLVFDFEWGAEYVEALDARSMCLPGAFEPLPDVAVDAAGDASAAAADIAACCQARPARDAAAAPQQARAARTAFAAGVDAQRPDRGGR